MTDRFEMDEKGWPKGFFDEVLGKWEGELERGPQGEHEEREGFERSERAEENPPPKKPDKLTG